MDLSLVSTKRKFYHQSPPIKKKGLITCLIQSNPPHRRRRRREGQGRGEGINDRFCECYL